MPMDFVDWRKPPDKSKLDPDATSTPRSRMRKGHYVDYIEELIREAQEQGKFSNLEGLGKPLNLEDESGAGDMAMAYHMLNTISRFLLPFLHAIFSLLHALLPPLRAIFSPLQTVVFLLSRTLA